MFHVLMEFAKADVNSPRSVRALSKVRIMKLCELRQTRIRKSSYLSSDSYRYMCVTSNTTLGWVKSFCVNTIAKMARIRTKIPRVLPNSVVCRCTMQTHVDVITHCNLDASVLCQSFHEQLLSGKKVSISSAVPRPFGAVHPQHAMPPRQVPPAPVVRQPLVGIDLQALNQAHKALKPPHASGNAKYMKGTANEPNKVCEITKKKVFMFDLS